MNYLKALRIAWRLAPWIFCAFLAIAFWLKPSAGSNSAPGQTITVAGEAALTKPAKKWKKKRVTCQPAGGGKSFPLNTREPEPTDYERLARQYGSLFDNIDEPPATETGKTSTEGAPSAGDTRVAAVLGEYFAPRLTYGGTMLATILSNGEPEFRFDPLSAPKFGWRNVFGVGGFYDLTANATGEDLNPLRHHRFYGFWEPFQTKQLYWQLEAGELQLPNGWEPYIGIGGQWRTEPWIPKNRRGLRAVKIPK